MKALTVKYDSYTDSTLLKFSNNMQNQDWLVKADILQELIAKLEVEYEMLMSIKDFDFRNAWELGNAEWFYEEYENAVSNFKSDILIKTATEI